ncbi:MAG TPA: phage terminase large subunit [Azospirillaceae bacterium]|nr:phage terminase large subunit [Azospirillaceae bacterium]
MTPEKIKPEDFGFPEFVWAWNDHQKMATPRVHKKIARWLERRRKIRDRHLLLMAFRGCGKSTLVGLFCAWLLTRDPNLRIMVLAADLDLAKKMVRTVKRIIERHPIVRRKRLKPERIELWGAEEFTVNRTLELRDPSMLARGIDSNITGSRAEVVICDDVEVPNTCDTAPKRAALRETLAEIDYILVPGGLQLYVGTPHTYYTIYADVPRAEIGERTPFLSGFSRLKIPVSDGKESVWPERFSEKTLESMEKRTGANKFRSQMMLEPVPLTDVRLDPRHLRRYEGELEYREAGAQATLTLDGRRLVSASCWWDPAFGRGGEGKADHSVIAAVFTDDKGGHCLHRVRYLKPDPIADEAEATQQVQEVVEFIRECHLPSVFVEKNGIGAFLPGLLRQALAQAKVPCAVIPKTSHRAKDLRIAEAFEVVLAARALSAHASVWNTPFIQEMRDWRPDGRGKSHDDGLDAVAGCLLSEPVRLGVTTRPPRSGEWRGGGGPVEAATDFDP